MQRARHTPGRAAGACAGPDNGDIQRSARQEAGGSGYSSRGATPRSKRALFLLSALMRETRISKNIFIITGRGEGRGRGGGGGATARNEGIACWRSYTQSTTLFQTIYI